jgi:hypothetical protein
VRAILGPADRVVVASQDDADRLRTAGLDAAKLSVAEETWWLPAAGGAADADAAPWRGRPAWTVPPGATRDALEAEARRRAARAREEDATSAVAASWPLQMLTPLAPAPAESSRPLFRLIKQYVHRLVAWEVVPIVEQVNHLQRATIESFDRQATASAADPRPAAPGADTSA